MQGSARSGKFRLFYGIGADVYDNLGGWAPTGCKFVYVLPTIALTAPANGATFSAPATIPLSATVTPPDAPIAKMRFYQGTTLIGEALSVPYSITWQNVGIGNYSLSARAVDNFDLEYASTPVNVTVTAAAAQLHFIHVDYLNTPRLVANQSGQTVWRWDQQEPFGNNPADENPSGLGAFEFDLRFPGHVWSKETQTAYNGHRDAYDPAIGRYPQSDPIGLEGAWSKLYAYRPRYLDVRAGRYVPEHPDRMNDARFTLIQGSMLFRRPLLASAIPLAQEFNTYAYANLNPMTNFDISGLQSESLEPPKGGAPSSWFSTMSPYEQCVAQACVAFTVAGLVVGRGNLVAGAGGFLGGFFLGGFFCPGDPPNLTPPSIPGKNPPSAPPKAN